MAIGHMRIDFMGDHYYMEWTGTDRNGTEQFHYIILWNGTTIMHVHVHVQRIRCRKSRTQANLAAPRSRFLLDLTWWGKCI